jgi:hypothetical protein
VSDDSANAEPAAKDPWSWTDKRLVIPATALAVAAIVGAIAFYWTQLGKLLADQNAPASVQAIGSVLAIFVAVIAPYVQTDKERQRREDAAFERRVRNTSIALAAVSYVSYIAVDLRKLEACWHSPWLHSSPLPGLVAQP